MYKSMNLALGSGYSSKLHIQKWLDFMKDGRNKVVTYPAFQNTSLLDLDNQSSHEYRDFWYMAAVHHLFVNIGYLARNDEDREHKESINLEKKLKAGHLDSDSIYVFNSKSFDVMKDAVKNKIAECEKLDGYEVCKSI